MPRQFLSKVGQHGNALRVTIPKVLARQLSLAKRDYVFLWADDAGRIVIERVSRDYERK
jgi:antitoxin component of MazEF toxin-antitoxin module